MYKLLIFGASPLSIDSDNVDELIQSKLKTDQYYAIIDMMNGKIIKSNCLEYIYG